MAITWDEQRMTTGVPDIDAQHQELIRRFNNFHDAVVHSHGKEAIGQTLRFLNEYARTHFSKEEACMAAYRCPAAATNKAEHDKVRAELAKIEERMDKAGIQSIDVVQLELILGNWIRNHICSVDVKLRECVPGGGE
jgi:hemerythrin